MRAGPTVPLPDPNDYEERQNDYADDARDIDEIVGDDPEERRRRQVLKDRPEFDPTEVL